MSGGYFDYIQFKIKNEAIEKLNEIISENHNYSDKTKKKILECLNYLRLGSDLLHEIDLLVSEDNSEETFIKNLSIKNML